MSSSRYSTSCAPRRSIPSPLVFSPSADQSQNSASFDYEKFSFSTISNANACKSKRPSILQRLPLSNQKYSDAEGHFEQKLNEEAYGRRKINRSKSYEVPARKISIERQSVSRYNKKNEDNDNSKKYSGISAQNKASSVLDNTATSSSNCRQKLNLDNGTNRSFRTMLAENKTIMNSTIQYNPSFKGPSSSSSWKTPICNNFTQASASDTFVSQQFFMQRLLQAHQIVDELLKSRGLQPEDERNFLRYWDQDPIIEEEIKADFSRRSSASDSGLSLDNDSDHSTLEEIHEIISECQDLNRQETESQIVQCSFNFQRNLCFQCLFIESVSPIAICSSALLNIVNFTQKRLYKSFEVISPENNKSKQRNVAKPKLARQKPASPTKSLQRFEQCSVIKSFHNPYRSYLGISIIRQISNSNWISRRVRRKEEKICKILHFNKFSISSQEALFVMRRKDPLITIFFNVHEPQIFNSTAKNAQLTLHEMKNNNDQSSTTVLRKALPAQVHKEENKIPIVAKISKNFKRVNSLDSNFLEKLKNNQNQQDEIRLIKNNLRKVDFNKTVRKEGLKIYCIQDYHLRTKKNILNEFNLNETQQEDGETLVKYENIRRIDKTNIGKDNERSNKIKQITPRRTDGNSSIINQHQKTVELIKPKECEENKEGSRGLKKIEKVDSREINKVRKERKHEKEDNTKGINHAPAKLTQKKSTSISKNEEIPIKSLANNAKDIKTGSVGSPNFTEISEKMDRIFINEFRREKAIPKPKAVIRFPSPIPFKFMENNPIALSQDRSFSPIKFIQRATPKNRKLLSEPSFFDNDPVKQHLTGSILKPTKKAVKSPPSLTSIQPSFPPQNRFGVVLKRVNRQKNETKCGAITNLTPKEPWIPKWRRIQRSEEKEEFFTKKEEKMKRSTDENRERNKMRRSSQIIDDKINMNEAKIALLASKKRQEEEEAAKLQDYKERRQIERKNEENELRILREKQERRRIERENEERQILEQKKLEEAERQQEAQKQCKEKIKKEKQIDEEKLKNKAVINPFGQMHKKILSTMKTNRSDKFGNIVQAKQEMGMTKDQKEEAKRTYLLNVKKSLILPAENSDELVNKIKFLHQKIGKLEAEKYDLEKRHERQEYDLKELNERQRQAARNKFDRKSIDSDDKLAIRHPPKVAIFSKYDRQVDRRDFSARRAIFENKNAYPCFPNIVPPPVKLKKAIKTDDDENFNNGIDMEIEIYENTKKRNKKDNVCYEKYTKENNYKWNILNEQEENGKEMVQWDKEIEEMDVVPFNIKLKSTVEEDDSENEELAEVEKNKEMEEEEEEDEEIEEEEDEEDEDEEEKE